MNRGIILNLICLCLAAAAQNTHSAKKGIQIPGVQIPIADLKPDSELPLAPHWMIFSDTVLIPNKAGGLNRLGANPVTGTSGLCGGGVAAFKSMWIPSCADHALLRFDVKIANPVRIDTGTGGAVPAVAANGDSVWILSDDKTTLSRVDPDQNKVVSELRLGAGCNTLTFGETALWVTCPSENRVLRINPETTLVEQRIAVSAQPFALAIGETSLWVLCLKDGRVERIDPKTNRVTKTIETGVSGAAQGGIAIGQGSVWVTQTGFPLTRIDPVTEKVAQQFWGHGGGAIHFGESSIWLTNLQSGTLWRIDPKRVLATLAE